LKKSPQLVKIKNRNCESPRKAQQTPLAFHPPAQRNASRRRDARLQSRTFARSNQSLRRSPNHEVLLRARQQKASRD
jgi:hypothetical protein